MKNKGATAMSEFARDLQQAMNDWDAATPEQREEALRIAAEAAGGQR
jgi:hypothetical protein